MVYIKILSPIVFFAIFLIQIALQEKWYKLHDGRTKKHKRVMAVLIFLLFIWTVFMCAVAYIDHTETSLLSDKVTTLVSSNKMLEKRVQLKTNQLVRLAEANANLTKGVSKSITGGDSYPNLIVNAPSIIRHGPDVKKDTCSFFLFTAGDYPLYDVSIEIDDVTKMKNIIQEYKDKGILPNKIPDFHSKYSKRFNIGNISPKTGLTICELKASGDEQFYNINILMRNGRVLQFIRFRKIDGAWKRAEKTYFNEKLIKEEIDPDFHRYDKRKIF